MINFLMLLALQIAYGYGCTATSDCQSGLSLICTTTGYLCNCPTTLSAYKCDCLSTSYYLSGSGCGKPCMGINSISLIDF